MSCPEQLETIACREVLTLASSLGLVLFKIACDCLNLVKSGQIVKEIKARMSFALVNILYTRNNDQIEMLIVWFASGWSSQDVWTEWVGPWDTPDTVH